MNVTACTLVTDRTLYDGYARVWRNRRHMLMHRAVYVDTLGPIPDDWDVHHTCETRNCVNVEHLIAVPHGVHSTLKQRKTHCPQGHELTPENTYEWRGTRKCRKCGNAATLRSRAKGSKA